MPTIEEPLLPGPSERPEWLASTSELLAGEGSHLVFEDGEIRSVPLAVGWLRIGRSAASDIRLDDPTVSRRHALVVRSAGGEIRVLDDRSLNGVRLNGSPVDWGTLADGDELAIGRFRLYLVALEPAGSGRSAPPSA
jgi:pSer/pThr/pTyr-binding forkhead associated (FHA) protein